MLGKCPLQPDLVQGLWPTNSMSWATNLVVNIQSKTKQNKQTRSLLPHFLSNKDSGVEVTKVLPDFLLAKISFHWCNQWDPTIPLKE